MAISCMVWLTLQVLILLASRGYCKKDQNSMEDRDDSLIYAVREDCQTLKSINDSLQEGLRIHKENSHALRELHSISDMVLQVKEEIQKQNEELSSVNGEKEALMKVIILIQENADLKIQLTNKDQQVDKLNQEIAALRKQLNNTENKVNSLNQDEVGLTTVIVDKNETEDTQKPVGWTRECEQQQRLEEIKEVVQAYINTRDWDVLKEGLETLLVNSSEAYTQLQRAESLWSLGSYGYTQLVSLLLCAGLPVDTTNSDGDNMLHGAGRGGRLHVVKLLLNHGADVNVRGRYDWTPLMRAAQGGYLDVVQWLVEAGADTTAKNKGGHTALYYSRSKGHITVTQYLEQLPH